MAFTTVYVQVSHEFDIIFFAAFISLVILRCCRQHLLPRQEVEEEPQPQQQQALVVAEVQDTQK